MVSLPTYDNNQFAEGITRKDFQALLRNPEPAAPQPRDQRAVPTGLDVQAGDRDSACSPTRSSDRPSSSRRRRTSRSGRTGSGTGTMPGSAASTSRSGFAHSSDTFFYQMAQRLGIERLGLLGAPARVRRADRHRPARRGPRDRPDQPVEAGHVRPGDLPRRGAPGRHRPGLRHGHAAPAPQRLRRAGQRRQAVPAPGRARGRGRRRAPSSGRSRPKLIRKRQDVRAGTSRSCGSPRARS